MTAITGTFTRSHEQLDKLLTACQENGGITKSNYAKYLTMQYYLTKDVQVHFFRLAAHPALRGYHELREFLLRFGFAEEPGYEIARDDLYALNETVGPCPLDMALWRMFFSAVIGPAPFVRLGATCLLQGLGEVAARHLQSFLTQGAFFSEQNTRFLQANFVSLPEAGETLFDIISQAGINNEEMTDLQLGAEIGATLVLRAMHWALGIAGDPLPALTTDIPVALLDRLEM